MPFGLGALKALGFGLLATFVLALTGGVAFGPLTGVALGLIAGFALGVFTFLAAAGLAVVCCVGLPAFNFALASASFFLVFDNSAFSFFSSFKDLPSQAANSVNHFLVFDVTKHVIFLIFL